MTYNIILLDPPWKFKAGGNRGCKYPTMSLKELKTLNVQSLASDNCAMFMWATMPCLPQALELIAAYGFTFKTIAFTWIKTNRNGSLFCGMGYWTRSNAEICILATRGKPKRIAKNVRQVIIANRGRHSEKPKETHKRIVELLGDLPRIELFARDRVAGWDVFGNEVESDVEL